jgi:hypothetical protein
MYPNDPERPDLEALVRKAHAERAYYLAELLSGGLAALGRGMSRAAAHLRTTWTRPATPPRPQRRRLAPR